MKFFTFKSLFFNCFTLCLIVIASVSKGQIVIPVSNTLSAEEREWVVTNLLDSMINKAVLNEGGIICLNENSITIDTVMVSKVKHIGSDSVVVGKFLKKNQKKISSKEFWGVITTSGKGRRFYNKEMYLVWETPSPYIYELDRYDFPVFYFSETLLSPVIYLNTENVNNSSLDDRSKEILNGVLEDRARAKEIQKQNNKEIIASVSLDLLSIILQVMVAGGGNSSPSHREYKAKTHNAPRTKR